MEESVFVKIEALKKQARESGVKSEFTLPNNSSLHKIINTQEKADAFMTLLYALQSKNAYKKSVESYTVPPENVRAKMEALKKQARESGVKSEFTLRNKSSLHKIINTKEKADAFMTLLYALQTK
jgi:predicted component of type VI protein secretion system